MTIDERGYEMKPWSRVKIETDEYQGKGHLVRQAETEEGDDRDFWVVLTDDGEMMTLLPSEFEVVDGPKPAVLCPGLRPCRAYYCKRGGTVEVTGVFHCWGVNFEEFEDGPANYTTAIVEADDGKVYECAAGSVQFLDRGPDNEERR